MSAKIYADFAGPLAYSASASNAQGVAATSAVYGVLVRSQLKLYDDQDHVTTSSPLAQPTSVIELTDYAACQAGPAQQGLTWELTLQRRITAIRTAGSESHQPQESQPRDGRRKSTVAGLENKKNWLKSKLRSKSISASASANSLAALAQSDESPPPMPSASTSAAAYATSISAPTRRLSIHTPARFSRASASTTNAACSSAVPPNMGSIILSTISKDMQQRWIAAICAVIFSNIAAPVLSPSASSPSSLANLAAYKMPRSHSPSPLMATTTASSEQSSSFLEVEPPSPRHLTFQEGETSAALDRRSSTPVNPFLPQWLADVRSATNKNGEPSSRSFGMRPSRSTNALLNKVAGGGEGSSVSIAISHHEDSSDSSVKSGKNASKTNRPSTANTLSPPALRPQRSSSSLSSSSQLNDSICSTAPSTNPPTDKAFNDSPPNNRQTMCFGEKSGGILPVSSSKGGWRRGFGFSSSDEEGRTSLGSLTSATSDQSTANTASTAFETPRRAGSDSDTVPIGSHIIEPAELRRRMMERGVLLDARPSTASGNIGDISRNSSKSTFGPGARLPPALIGGNEKILPPHHLQYTKPEGLDVQALFAALPPPKKRSNTGHLSGMKTSSSSGSINSLARSRAIATSAHSPSNNSPVHSPLAL